MTKATENRRKFGRYSAAGAPACVIYGAETFTATIVDESIGGLCLILDGSPPLSIGDSLEIDFRDAKGTAFVRSAQRLDENQARLGVSWEPPGPDEIPAEPLRPLIQDTDIARSSTPTVRVTDTVSFEIMEQVYYTHGSISVVCHVVGIADTGQVKILLTDGTRFLADCRNITTRTRFQRLLDLETADVRQTLGKVYGTESTAEAILEYEFS